MAPLASLANFTPFIQPLPLPYNIIPFLPTFVKGLFRLRVASCVLRVAYRTFCLRPDGSVYLRRKNQTERPDGKNGSAYIKHIKKRRRAPST